MVAFGDSITAAPGSWVELVATALGADLTNHAVPGKEAHTVLEQQLPLLSGRYDLGALYVGTNDVRRAWDPARFEVAVGECAEAIAATVNRLWMPTLPLSLYRLPRAGSIHSRTAEANRIIRRTAARVGAGVVDLDDCAGRGYWSADRIHPSPAGQAVIASRALGAAVPGDRTPLPTYLAGTVVAAGRALVGAGPA